MKVLRKVKVLTCMLSVVWFFNTVMSRDTGECKLELHFPCTCHRCVQRSVSRISALDDPFLEKIIAASTICKILLHLVSP